MSQSNPATLQDVWALDNLDGPGTYLDLSHSNAWYNNTQLLDDNGWNGHRFPINWHYYYYYYNCSNLSPHLGPVDFLSVDTQSNNLNVLRRWFQMGGQARLVAVLFHYKESTLNQLIKVCQQNNMEFSQLRGFVACFVNNDLTS